MKELICVVDDVGIYHEKEELIRCKDCKYWWKKGETCKHEKMCLGDMCVVECYENFHCGYAERKEE